MNIINLPRDALCRIRKFIDLPTQARCNRAHKGLSCQITEIQIYQYYKLGKINRERLVKYAIKYDKLNLFILLSPVYDEQSPKIFNCLINYGSVSMLASVIRDVRHYDGIDAAIYRCLLDYGIYDVCAELASVDNGWFQIFDAYQLDNDTKLLSESTLLYFAKHGGVEYMLGEMGNYKIDPVILYIKAGYLKLLKYLAKHGGFKGKNYEFYKPYFKKSNSGITEWYQNLK